MIDQQQDGAPAQIPKSKNWVLHCTNESLESGQVSVLSIVETVLAIVIYYLFAQDLWWFLITAFAAPIVLLRSDASVALGIKTMKSYIFQDLTSVHKLKGIVAAVLVIAANFILCYWLTQRFLTGYYESTLFWKSVLIGIAIAGLIFPLTYALVQAITGKLFDQGYFAVAIVGAVLGIIVGMMVLNGGGWNLSIALIGGGVGLVTFIVGFGAILVFFWATTNSIIHESENSSFARFKSFYGNGNGNSDRGLDSVFLRGVFTTTWGIGVLLRSQFIRAFSTLRHPFLGIKELPLNWHKVNWCLDITHPPELLPNAGSIYELLSVSGIWEGRSDLNKKSKAMEALVLLPIWYIPSVIWRFSLKATLWLWWPLALVFKEPFKAQNMYQIRKSIVTIVSGWWKWLVIPTVIVIPWLLSGFYNEVGDLVRLLLPNQLSKLFDKLALHAIPDPRSLRYAAIWLVCILSLLVWWKANSLKNQFAMVISDETYITQIENDEKYWQQKQDFYKQAESISRWHMWRIVSIILLGYSYILYLSFEWYPEQVGRFVFSWIIPYL